MSYVFVTCVHPHQKLDTKFVLIVLYVSFVIPTFIWHSMSHAFLRVIQNKLVHFQGVCTCIYRKAEYTHLTSYLWPLSMCLKSGSACTEYVWVGDQELKWKATDFRVYIVQLPCSMHMKWKHSLYGNMPAEWLFCYANAVYSLSHGSRGGMKYPTSLEDMRVRDSYDSSHRIKGHFGSKHVTYTPQHRSSHFPSCDDVILV